MPDYAHPVRFGVFITPAHSTSPDPVAAAVAADEAGLDLVTFQDHPYQPTFHDTWTLLSFVAARTQHVTLAGNVLNLPLRPPAVLARSLASLDLLSGGRVAAGLGTGAFFDAIEAMGGPHHTGREAVDALIEAVEIMRELWDTGSHTPVRVDGQHYRVHGAKRGPAPAHTIPIWLGAYGPRMLRTVGRIADGWLPSLSYLKPGDLQRGNAEIDAAATKAGRDPREIVRMLNVDPTVTADRLTRMALDDGISVFIVPADDPRQMQQIAGSLAPAVRDAVESARQSAGTARAGVMRSAAIRAKRTPGIRYDDVPETLRGRVVEPGDAGYGRYTASYLRGGAPGLVLRPTSAAEVSDAVRFAAGHRELPLGIFSAGHGISGRSLNRGGIVIDVGALNEVTVLDADAGRVRIGPGARWVEVARALAPYGLAISSGDYGGVGVGGLATAGGVGLFAREQGLTIDLLRAVQIVLADGTIVRADAHDHSDLFWAVRGAGANVGIVTEFEFAAGRATEIGFAQLVFDATDIESFLARWGAAVEAAPRTVSGEIIMGPPRSDGRSYATAMMLVNAADPDDVIAALQPIADVAPLIDQQVAVAGYDEVLGAFFRDGPQQGRGEPTCHCGLVDHITDDFAREAATMLRAGATYFFQIRAVGGATTDVAADETAFAWRDANFVVSAMGTRRSGLEDYWPGLTRHFNGMYISFETDTGPAVVARAFPPDTLARLREIKRRYDPQGVFRDNFFIDPDRDPAAIG